jgi:hypothetical protein
MSGNFQESLKHSFRAKEYVSSNQQSQLYHLLEIWFLILSATFEAKDFRHVISYVDKIQSVTNTMSTSNSSTKVPHTNATSSSSSSSSSGIVSETEILTRAKCHIILGLTYLHDSLYKSAAESFLHIIIPARSEQHINHLTVYEDIAVYTILCSIATFTRKDIKSKILDNLNFKIFLEYTMYMKKFLTDFMDGAYAACYQFLDHYKAKFKLDYYLSSHINTIYDLIYEKILLQYLVPYKTVDITRMTAVLGMPYDQLETRLVKQIQNGHIQGRINSMTKTLHCYGPTGTSGSSGGVDLSDEREGQKVSKNQNINDLYFLDLSDTSEQSLKYNQNILLARIHSNVVHNQLLLHHVLLKLDVQKYNMSVRVGDDDITGRRCRKHSTVSTKQSSLTGSAGEGNNNMLLSGEGQQQQQQEEEEGVGAAEGEAGSSSSDGVPMPGSTTTSGSRSGDPAAVDMEVDNMSEGGGRRQGEGSVDGAGSDREDVHSDSDDDDDHDDRRNNKLDRTNSRHQEEYNNMVDDMPFDPNNNSDTDDDEEGVDEEEEG